LCADQSGERSRNCLQPDSEATLKTWAPPSYLFRTCGQSLCYSFSCCLHACIISLG
jgi:hypothetical protein